MASVFVCFARPDRERVKPIIERLRLLGYTFVESAEEASIVLAAWSRNARSSTAVLAHACAGAEAATLTQVRLDQAPIPSPFDALQVIDMSGAGEVSLLEDALARHARGDVVRINLPRASVQALPPTAGAARLTLLALTLTLAAFTSALVGAFNGVLSPAQLSIVLYGALGVAVICAGLSLHRLILITRAGD